MPTLDTQLARPAPFTDGAADTLERLEARLARIETALDRLSSLSARVPDAIATATDTFDSLVARAAATGFDLDERLALLLRAADGLTSAEAVAALEATLASGLLEPGVVAVVGKLGRALAAVDAAPRPVGALGVLRALRDPDVQRAVGFAVALARTFGRALDPARLLPEPR